MTREQEDALREFERISKAVKACAGGKAGDSNEKRYSQAYQLCVRLGVSPQIRKKYR